MKGDAVITYTTLFAHTRHSSIRHHRLLLVCLAFILSLWFPLDSQSQTTGSANVAPPSTTPANIIFWDSGSVDFARTFSTSTTVAQGTFTTNRPCPLATDTPYIVLSAYKTETQPTGMTSICVNPPLTPTIPALNLGYIVSYTSNGLFYSQGATTTGKPYGTNIAFNWALYCYRGSVTPPAYDTACSAPSFSYDKPLPLWDMGFINWPTVASTVGNNTFSTNRICPAGYLPYFTLAPTKTAYSAYYIIQGSGVCFIIAQPQANGTYTVAYLAIRRVAFAEDINYGFWVGTNNAAWTAFSTTPLPAFATYVDQAGADANIGGINWMLYCLPPGYPEPLSVCQMGANPF